MSVTSLLSRFRYLLKAGAIDPAGQFGSVFGGTYEPKANTVSGVVGNISFGSRFPPVSMAALLYSETIGITREFVQAGGSWRFDIPLSVTLTADDILKERLQVLAYDYKGAASQLKIDGAMQLTYVREAMAPPSNLELVIDFTKGGNSVEFVRDGWSGQEATHTWTDGSSSTIWLPFAVPGARYVIEILAWPYTVEGKIPGQTMQVFIGASLLHTFYVPPGNSLLSYTVPGELTQAGPALNRLEYLDAVRPCDVTDSKEGRKIAIAFRQLKLRQLH